jgi:hypothetical protein
MAERNIVVLAGSGRSGTTWLGSILDTYSRADYFYEIDAYPELAFDSPDLLRSKYPFTQWLKYSPTWVQRLEHRLLLELQQRRMMSATVARALRIRNRYRYKTGKKDTNLFKVVQLFSFAVGLGELASRHRGRLKVVHLVRNPYAQLVSQRRMKTSAKAIPEKPFNKAFESMLTNPRLEKYRNLAKEYEDAPWLEKCAVVWWVGNEVVMGEQMAGKTTVIFERLARNPLREVERLFEFLGWPLSSETHDHILETTDAARAEPGNHAIHKKADHVLHQWRENLSYEDYQRAARVLEECGLMGLWSREELAWREEPE